MLVYDGDYISDSVHDGDYSSDIRLDGDYGEYKTVSDIPEYQGEYEVTPEAFEKQTLDTAGKQMADNVTVHEIPYFEVSNPKGETVYIGSVL